MSLTEPRPVQGAPRIREVVRENLRVAMARKSLNQTELAAELDVQPSWVNRRLTGAAKIDLPDLEVLGHALDVTPAQLITVGGV